MKEKKERLNTQLESAGAEYLVLGNLLRYRIQSFITSQNFEDYDIVATNPEKNKSIKIQVKSRLKNSDTSFPIKKFGSDFVVFVKLNCGMKRHNKMCYKYKDIVEYYIIPTKICKENVSGDWSKIYIRELPKYEKYKNNWDLIRKKLRLNKNEI